MLFLLLALGAMECVGDASLQAAVLLVASGLLVLGGAWSARQRRRCTDGSSGQPGSRLPADPPPLFRRAQQMRGRGEAACLLVVELRDLPEVSMLFGAATARHACARLSAQLAVIAGTRGSVSRMGMTAWAVLVPQAHPDCVLERVKRLSGGVLSVEIEAGGEEIILVPAIQMRSTQDAEGSMETLYLQMREEIGLLHDRAQRRERRLRREHDSYTSRSAGLLV